MIIGLTLTLIACDNKETGAYKVLEVVNLRIYIHNTYRKAN